METISDIFKKYYRKLDCLDLELLVAHCIEKPREFVLAHPECKLHRTQNVKLEALIKRRLKHEPIAYILEEKEFYGLPFKVNKATLIPRPETELIVEKFLSLNPKNSNIIDIGTGSGNIIISLAYSMKHVTCNKFYGIDINTNALKVAKQNAKLNGVEKKIKFIKGDTLSPVISNPQSVIGKSKKLIIIANLPYLSKKIYDATMPDVKKFEPKSALYSAEEGLAHYQKLFEQVKKIQDTRYKTQTTIFLEFSPEQNKNLEKMVKNFFPKAKTTFYKDLASKWRILEITI